jgi:hypothetical protein
MRIKYCFIAILFFTHASHAAEYTSIKIYPEHVGVFTTVGEQQFVAYGLPGDVNITEQVGWYTSDESIVTIDATGLAKIHSPQGRVKVLACYPKPCAPKAFVPHNNVIPTSILLLGLDKAGKDAIIVEGGYGDKFSTVEIK